MPYQITTQKELRAAFWNEHPKVDKTKWRVRGYAVDTRCAFADYIDALCRDGVISEALASRQHI